MSFSSRTELSKAMETMKNLKIGSREVSISIPKSWPVYNAKTSIFVAGLPKTFKEEDLVALFTKFGTIFACMVVLDKETKEARDISFIDFEKEEFAQNAIKEMNGAVI